MKFRPILTNLAVSAVALVLALAVGEIVLRVSPSLINPAVVDRFHPTLRAEISERIGITTKSDLVVVASAERADGGPALYLYKPDTAYAFPLDDVDKAIGGQDKWSTDSRGFCNPAGSDTKSHADIVSIGNSISFCTAVPPEESYAAMVERLTGQTAYSLDLPGIGPYEYVEILRRSGIKLTPRIVLMNISEGDDLRDIERFLAFRSGESPEFRKKEPLGGPFAISYALAFLKGAVEQLGKDLGEAWGPDFRYTVTVESADVAMNTANKDPDELDYARKIETGDISPALYEEPIVDLVALSASANFRPVVVYIPSPYTAYADSVRFPDPAVATSLRTYSDTQREWLADNADRLGYDFIDTTEALQAASVTGPLTYFPSNLHLTTAGHRAAAEAVAAGLSTLITSN